MPRSDAGNDHHRRAGLSIDRPQVGSLALLARFWFLERLRRWFEMRIL
jgi:hypothetical protein